MAIIRKGDAYALPVIILTDGPPMRWAAGRCKTQEVA